jgi:adenylosuccinate synthase
VVVRYSARINGLDALAVTKLDVLDGLDELKICTGYRIGGRDVREFPADLSNAGPVEAIYETLPGWHEPTRGARDFDELPQEARQYVQRLEEVSGVPAAIVSTGSDRDETIVRQGTAAATWLESKGN